jgi:predicted NAD/FAD-dependent oxidoreductase
LLVDDEPALAAALCMPDPQARRVFEALPTSPITWEPVIAVTCVFAERTWPDLDGVFVNDDPVLTWIADDGRRRGDDAPVLVAHVNPVLAALYLHNPSVAVAPAVATIQRVLGITDYPEWVDSHRWSFAKPLAASPEPYWLHEGAAVGAAGDAWSDGPKVEAAWLSGHRLGRVLAERVGEGVSGER